MLFRASQVIAESSGLSMPQPLTGNYVSLRHSRAKAGERYTLPLPSSAAAVRLDSPATAVMTDLRKVSAVTIDRDASIANANQLMISRGVRALFVVDDARQVRRARADPAHQQQPSRAQQDAEPPKR